MSRRSASASDSAASARAASARSPLVRLNRLDDWPGLGAHEALLRRVALEGLVVGARASGGHAGPEEVSFTFVSREEIRDLNRLYLQRDEPTDVLAFDLGSHGDVYIAHPVAELSASERGIPVAEEAARLIVHAALHLTGHDHPEDDARDDSPMFRMQESVLARLS